MSSPLLVACPRCGARSASTHFCPGCGLNLTAPDPAPARIQEPTVAAGKGGRSRRGYVAAAALLLAGAAATAAIVVSPWADDHGTSRGETGASKTDRAARADEPADPVARADVPEKQAPIAAGEAEEPAFAEYTPPGGGYSTRVPNGPGWSEPSESEPTPGRLFRTTVAGPGGLIALIDYTPLEPAIFGGSYLTRAPADAPAYGTATRYVFQGGTIPQCQNARCVDYVVNAAADGPGVGVLVGGSSDLPLAMRVAHTMVASLANQRP